MSDYHIMYKHVLPNAMVAALTFLPFILNGSITLLTSLVFLGLDYRLKVPLRGGYFGKSTPIYRRRGWGSLWCLL